MTQDELILRYRARLGLTETVAPNGSALAALMARHMQCVPFENLDVVTGLARPLDTQTVLEKIATTTRGGFCYELNEAFRVLLVALGFAVRRIEARVWLDEPQCFGAPFDHLALVVTLPEGDFLVDVGFGDSNRTPLRLPADESVDVSGRYHLEHRRDTLWGLRRGTRPLYDMTLDAQPLTAFAPMCRYHQTAPQSLFAKGLICTKATRNGRITLSRDRLTRIEDGRREERVVDATKILPDVFGIVGLPNLAVA